MILTFTSTCGGNGRISHSHEDDYDTVDLLD
jgi:hypothetical protein